MARMQKMRITLLEGALAIRLFLEKVNSDREIKARVDAFLSELRKSVKEHRVMMPIEQLELLNLNEVKIGNVRLIPFSSLKEEQETLSKFVRPEDENKIWGDVIVKAELDEAYPKGRREIERVINLLRAYIPMLFHKAHNKKIGLYRYDLKSHHYLTIDDHGNIGGEIEHLGPFGNYRLSKKRLDPSFRTNGLISKHFRRDLLQSFIK